MKALHTWENIKNEISRTTKLYNDKVVLIKHFDRGDYEKTYSFNDFLEYKYTFASPEIDCLILKKIVTLEKPSNLNTFAEKVWVFWSDFNNEEIEDEKIFIDKNNFYLKSKYGFAKGYYNIVSKRITLNSWQRHDHFFFFGPYLYGLPLSIRKRLKEGIFNLIGSKQSNLTLNDGFVLFDYDKIEKVNFEKNNGSTGKYFKIIDGKVILGGWDNARDGGETYSSIEFLWYNMKSRLYKDFHGNIDYLVEVLEKAIVDEKYESNQKLLKIILSLSS